MASDFAKTLVKQLDNYAVVSNRVDVSELYVDSQLQEVREVLEGLSLLRSDGSRCFCEDGLYNKQHQENCLRAQSLLQRLELK